MFFVFDSVFHDALVIIENAGRRDGARGGGGRARHH